MLSTVHFGILSLACYEKNNSIINCREIHKFDEFTESINGEKAGFRIEKDLLYLSYVAYKENQNEFLVMNSYRV